MNRTELTAAIAARAALPPGDVDRTLDAFASVITEQLVNGERVTVPGFLTFETVDRAARVGRNPRTGEPLAIPARRVPRIVAGAGLKRAVDGH